MAAKHALPTADAPLWRRLAALEPAVVRGLIGAVVALGLIWGIDLTALGDQLTATADILGTIALLLTPLWVRQATTPTSVVVEQVDRHMQYGAVVIAGPANDRLPEGEPIRDLHA